MDTTFSTVHKEAEEDNRRGKITLFSLWENATLFWGDYSHSKIKGEKKIINHISPKTGLIWQLCIMTLTNKH